jgi:hypothetical protein
MLIIDMLSATGALFLLICTVLCVFAINQGRGRRKARAYKQMLFTRVMYF